MTHRRRLVADTALAVVACGFVLTWAAQGAWTALKKRANR